MGAYHPQVVHFAVALVFVGVGCRLFSLVRRSGFASAAATLLILLGTLACFAAVYTGVEAHGPVERIPGVRPAVVDHEEWGERARNVFVLVSILEIAALVLSWRQHGAARPLTIAAAVAGVAGLGVMYQTAAHGGDLVYGYAGGVGIRSGSPEDVNRLFATGVYQQALQDRQNGRNDEAMALVEMAAARFPSNLEWQLMTAEWTTEVRRDPAAALRHLDSLQIPSDDGRARVRAGIARANALAAQDNVEGARAVLRTLQAEFPENPRVKQRLEELSASSPR